MAAILQQLAATCSASAKDIPARDACISAYQSSLTALDKGISGLGASSGKYEAGAIVFALMVAFGVVGELVVLCFEYQEEKTKWKRGLVCPPDRPSVRIYLVTFIAIIFVAVGVLGEAWATKKLEEINSQLRSETSDLQAKSEQLLSLVTQQAGTASSSASIAKTAADAALNDLYILESRVSGRQIIDTTPIKSLRLKAKVVYVVSGDTEEAKSFCNSIAATLQDNAGMNIKPMCQSTYAGAETIVRGPSFSESQALAIALREATHFPFATLVPPHWNGPNTNDDLKVFVGPQPPVVFKPRPTEKPSNSRP